MDRYTQESLIDNIIHNLDKIDYDLLEKLRSHLDANMSEENKCLKFIQLYKEADDCWTKLLSIQYTTDYDIWEVMWNKLFDNPGWIHQAYKLHKFDTDIIDSSYEDEVRDIMYNWKRAVEYIKKEYE
jgi:hypothetical protein